MGKILDVIIIGAGTAGLAALREVRKRTEDFLIVNDGPWGTVCARVGCMPSKALIEAANAFHRRTAFPEFGIHGSGSLEINIADVLHRVRRLRDEFVAGTTKVTTDLGKRAISGRARLIAPNRVEVNGQELCARNIIIATGSSPVIPEAWHPFKQHILTTDTLFEQDNFAPRMAVVGMGPIGVEMAQALSRLGIDVVGFGRSPRIAGLTDPHVNAVATASLSQEWPIYLGEKAELTEKNGKIHVRAGGTEVIVDSVLAALGRRPNISDLGLEALGITLDDHGMPPINPTTMQVADLRIFMAGDANARTALLHEAADEGHIAGINATRSIPICFSRRTPLAIVFSDPNIAIVGSRYDVLDSGTTLIGEITFSNQGRARLGQRNKGMLRLYAHADSGRLLGAEMCAPDGEHMAHLLALAIDRSLSVRELLRMPFYHPVLEEGLRTALRNLAAQLPAGNGSDLTMCEAFNLDALD
ncbi:dihydrolipoyl dehydrogenase [Nitrosomonas sp. JL21]|uniref:dihydrolipoyl dehydrogenase n=1 Tax=Nitrosomonas sp. JL21 TaxID=153949 RepID=UPI00136B963F|nr:dihydrolipoyl dehydrogenase [Nitrosomonas sp. JL21]MBL8496841.1 dihydrolipoyl dehydrogenase [Nitrosomonas sp.]MBL8498407.1 dihydrolipoyl dehydrogenase [Nitrosomonas sp.]MCC7090835.1 dihydrolipoyl dehydrogenase [Nitrosomonas sp.]MXS77615.1 dihydrolipoyl dehydrogenase [Nitrosomonas sp. JL21]